MKISFFILLLLLTATAATSYAQETKTTPTGRTAMNWDKPYDFAYYNVMPGYIKVTGTVNNASAGALWGQSRISLTNFIIGRLPRHRFQVRDIVDLQAGAGGGKKYFYVNVMFAGGIKFKYDISSKIDFGTNITYRLGLDEIAHKGAMIHGFFRYDHIFVEAGTGGTGDISPEDKERKYTNVNIKYFFSPRKTNTWSVNFTWWNIRARNNQIGNPWDEVSNQYMIGIGKQLH